MRAYAFVVTIFMLAVRAAGGPTEYNILSALAPHEPATVSTSAFVHLPVSSSISDGLESVVELLHGIFELMLMSTTDSVGRQESPLQQRLQPTMQHLWSLQLQLQ